MEDYPALNLEECKWLVRESAEQQRAGSLENTSQESELNSSEDAPQNRSKCTTQYMALIIWLVENRITSEQQWIQENQESYLSYSGRVTLVLRSRWL